MKFRFCGDADCPDWILAEINTLSRLSSVKLKQLGQLVVKSIIEPPIEIERAEKLVADSKLDKEVDLKTCIACLTFVLTSAIRYNCDQSIFSSELQQIGLPREHSQSVRRVFIDNTEALTATLRSKTLRINKLDGVTTEDNPDLNSIVLNLTFGNDQQELVLPSGIAHQMLKEMQILRDKMKDLCSMDHAL